MQTLTVEPWPDEGSNQAQQYLTHGLFRYFGKLPPTVTNRVLDAMGVQQGSEVVDVMVGSGTTLVEARRLGAKATGVDANPLSVLVAKVKSTNYSAAELSAAELDGDRIAVKARIQQEKSSDADIRNIDHWFNPRAKLELGALRDAILSLPGGASREILMVALAATVRPASNASVRTGRLFRDRDKEPSAPTEIFQKRLGKILSAVSGWGDIADPGPEPTVHAGDARKTGLPSASCDAVFCHPPYFTLYRYSSDITRFELAWLDLDRKAAAAREIEDGFKTTDATLVNRYISDLQEVAREAGRIGRSHAKFSVITAETTLRGEPLNIMNRLIEAIEKEGWHLARRFRREVKHAQASYHRSAKDIKRADDEILLFERGK